MEQRDCKSIARMMLKAMDHWDGTVLFRELSLVTPQEDAACSGMRMRETRERIAAEIGPAAAARIDDHAESNGDRSRLRQARLHHADELEAALRRAIN